MDSIRLLFAFTLVLLVGFSISFTQIGWLGGVAWVRARGW
jgi:hypothetical protein